MRKKLSLLIAMAMTMTVFAGGASTSEAKVKDELTFAFFRGMESVNPHTTAGEMWFQEMVYETLVSVENSGIEPCLAESWDVSEDGLTYTFHLRKGVTFTNGVALDAHAIEKNFNNIWADRKSLKWLESLAKTEKYGAVDDMTFQIVLTSPYYPLLTELGLARPYGIGAPEIFIPGTPRKVTGAIGTGPYKLVKEVKDEYVVMEANQDYWGGVPDIKKITMKVIPENQTRVMALESGEIDIIYGANVLDAGTLQIYQNSDRFSYSTSAPSLTKHIVLNANIPGLNDVAVRQAIQHAINKEAIAQGIYYGIEKPAGQLFAKNQPYCDVDLKPYNFDMKKAAQLLEDAGWKMNGDGIREKDGVKLSFAATFDNNSVACKPILEYLKSEFKPLGINLKLQGYERATYFDKQKGGDFEIVMGVPWGQPYDPHASLAAFRTPAYGDFTGLTGVSNHKEIFDNITKFLLVTDDGERQVLITKVLTDLHEAAVHVPLVYESNKALYTKDLKKVTFAPNAYTFPFWDFKY